MRSREEHCKCDHPMNKHIHVNLGGDGKEYGHCMLCPCRLFRQVAARMAMNSVVHGAHRQRIRRCTLGMLADPDTPILFTVQVTHRIKGTTRAKVFSTLEVMERAGEIERIQESRYSPVRWRLS